MSEAPEVGREGAEKVAQGAPRRTRRRRLQPLAIAALTVVWLVLVGEVSVVTVVGGALIGLLVTLVFPMPPVHYGGRLRPLGLLRLLVYQLVDLAVSSVRLALVAFRGPLPHPGVLRVRLHSDSDLYQVATAELASVVPGTIIIDARAKGRLLYVHVFDLPDPERGDEVVSSTLALEERVLRALGSRDEIRALTERRGATDDSSLDHTWEEA